SDEPWRHTTAFLRIPVEILNRAERDRFANLRLKLPPDELGNPHLIFERPCVEIRFRFGQPPQRPIDARDHKSVLGAEKARRWQPAGFGVQSLSYATMAVR